MKIGSAVEIAVQLLEKHKLQAWSLEIDANTSMTGWCIKKQKIIGISRFWVKVCNKKEVTDTILHEIAHALVTEYGHGREWKDKAKEIGAIPKAKVDKVLFLKLEKKIKKLTKII